VDDVLNQQIGIIQQQSRAPTPDAFSRLLGWLDGGADSQGQKYEEMRRKLVAYFDRKDCRSPDDLADETFNRVIKWLEEQGRDYDPEPAKICYNTARFVFHEYLRRPDCKQDDFDAIPATGQPSADPRRIAALEEEREEREKRLACLEKCTEKLPADDRDLIIRYYYGEQRGKLENRKALAAERGLTSNALSIKACRIRDKLRECVGRCV